jgi:signal transduction histidine kinase
VAISADRAGNGDFVLAVTDTGIGIAPENIAVALAPFGQIEQPGQRQHDGLGLGLPLSRKFAELHGGALTIGSVVGTGTRVAITLPAARALSAPIGLAASA